MLAKVRRKLNQMLTIWSYRSKSRSNYKGVWNTQAQTERGAKLGVGGFTSEREFRETADHTLAALQRTVGVHPTDRVLEIGAGVGRVGSVVAPLCREWIGTDVSGRMVSTLDQRLASVPNVKSMEVSGYDLSAVPDNSIDMVYSTVVFMHLEEWDRYAYVKEAYRILSPGGRCYVDNFNLLSENGWRTFEEHCTIRPADRLPHMSKSSTPQELDAYFRHVGFENIQQEDEEPGGFIITWGVKGPALA